MGTTGRRWLKLWWVLVFVIGLVARIGTVGAQSAPVIETSVASGAVGTVVKISGSAFPSRASGSLRWDGSAIIGSYQSNTNGRYRVNIIVPSAAAGLHTIAATDATGATLVTAQFTVLAPVQALSLIHI